VVEVCVGMYSNGLCARTMPLLLEPL